MVTARAACVRAQTTDNNSEDPRGHADRQSSHDGDTHDVLALCPSGDDNRGEASERPELNGARPASSRRVLLAVVPPHTHPLVKQVLQSCLREQGRPVRKAPALPPNVLMRF